MFLSNLLKFPEAPEDFKLDAESNKHRILQPRPAAFYHLCSAFNEKLPHYQYKYKYSYKLRYNYKYKYSYKYKYRYGFKTGAPNGERQSG